jgi:hypothetical protein
MSKRSRFPEFVGHAHEPTEKILMSEMNAIKVPIVRIGVGKISVTS